MKTPIQSQESKHLFYSLPWADPVTRRPLACQVLLEDPSGRPLYGALVDEDGRHGYPIVGGILYATPQLARRERAWLAVMGLEPPIEPSTVTFQDVETVDSFGFQWLWDSEPRTEEDLQWRVASRYQLDRTYYRGKLVLDAGSGAGDQSRFLLDSDVKALVSVDLSAAIQVAYQKLSSRKNWIGIRGDLTRLPLADATFDFVYCEGVIQHTHDSQMSVNELSRVLAHGGTMSATHYGYLAPLSSGLKPLLRRTFNAVFFRNRWERLSKWNRDTLFLYTGVIAWLAHRRVIGPVLRRIGYATYNPRMLTFKATWSATYDSVGTHSFQRELTGPQFRKCFELVPGGSMSIAFADGNVLLVRKMEAIRDDNASFTSMTSS